MVAPPGILARWSFPTNMNPTPVTTNLVLVGGGHAHIEVIRRFGMQPIPGVRLTIISRDIHTPYSGMLPGLIAGHYNFDETHIDLGPLASVANARLLHDEAIGLDLTRRTVICRTRPPVSYDFVSVDTGSAPSTAAIGAADFAVPVKPVSSFYMRWQALRERVLADRRRRRIGVVGGGAAGVELLLAARYRLRRDLAETGDSESRLSFHLLTASGDILPSHNVRARALFRDLLQKAGIEIRLDCTIAAVEPGAVQTREGERIALDEVLWVTTAAAPSWPRESGLATDAEGFIRVDECLRSISHTEVFAAGDIAHFDAHPRPKSGVFAVRQGPPLATNLRHAILGTALEPFVPQRHALSLISTGQRHAIAARGSFALAGGWIWRWKDRIDRRFMGRYTDLPRMPVSASTTSRPADASEPAMHAEPMRCGGCGSKLGAELLNEALDALRQPPHSNVVIGLDAPDDAAVVAVPAGALIVHTVDAFRSFIDDPWLFGRITANHCLSDIFAMGAVPQTALAIVTLPLASPGKMRDDLVQLLSGALELLAEENTALVGGHSAEGAELSLGFAVNGYAREHELLRKVGAKISHALVLTRPLGSGVLLAAAMRGAAKWRWLEPCLDAMSRSNGPAARCLRAHGAQAMTDVTGFGLAGHLLEMLRADRLAAALDLDAIPLFDGAATLARNGIRSSLYPENLRVSAATNADASVWTHPHFDLCFDPQTAGGLLCALPRENAAACVRELHALGYSAASVIGQVIEQDAPQGPRIVFQC